MFKIVCKTPLFTKILALQAKLSCIIEFFYVIPKRCLINFCYVLLISIVFNPFDNTNNGKNCRRHVP